MTDFTAAGYLSNSARTEAEVKTAFEDNLAATKQLLGGAPQASYTIAADVITPTASHFLVDTQGAAATDDLRNILTTNLPIGSMILFRTVAAGRTVVVKNAAGGSGQINLWGGADFTMNSNSLALTLSRSGADWYEVQRVFGPADGAAQRAFYGGASLGYNTFTGRQDFNLGTGISAATTLAIGTGGNTFVVAGSAIIGGMAAAPAGAWVRLQFLSSSVLVHHPTTFVLAGGVSFTVAPGTVMDFVSGGGGAWYEASRSVRGPSILFSAAIGATVNAAQPQTAIWSTTIPAGILGFNGRLRLHATGRIFWAVNAGDYVFFGIRFGTTVTAVLRATDPPSLASEGFILDVTITNHGSAGQQVTVGNLQVGHSMGGSVAVPSRGIMDYSTSSIDTTSAVTLQVEILWSSAGAAPATQVSFDNATVELMA